MTYVHRLIASDSAFALAIILPVLGGIAVIAAITFAVCDVLR